MAEKGLNIGDWKKLLADECRLRGYSEKTIKSYTFHVKKYLASGKSAREYLIGLIKNQKKDETVRSAGFAIKFYLKIIGADNSLNLPNVKREKRLPVILSKPEVERMAASTVNLKHRTMILIGYSAGLRASEIINLRWSDVDFKRKIVHIKRAKGKKDRIVMLSPKIKKLLKSLSSDNSDLIFRSNRGGKYSIRALQKIVSDSARKAGIKKKVTPHTLRHSFATHLLEKGTDIRYIKELLGHANISTTLIYTKVSNKDISRIRSPLD